MKVLHILSGDLWGGSEVQVQMQMAALRQIGVDAQALFFNDLEPKQRYAQSHIPTYVASENAGIIQLLKESLKHSRAMKPQLIAAHGYKEMFVASYLSSKLEVPIVITLHGKTENYSGKAAFKIWCYLALRRFLIATFAKRIIIISKTLASELGYSNSRKSRIIYNVVSNGDNVSQDSEVNLESSTKKKIVIVGRLVSVKRVDLAIKAVAELCKKQQWVDNLELLIVGDGHKRSELEALSKDLGLSNCVTFTGFRNDASSLIANADALLITSDSEGIPTVLLEAIRSETPVVHRKLGGITEVLNELTDYPAKECTVNTPSAIADALESILLTQHEKNTGRFLEVLDRKFSPQAAASKLKQIYSELIP